MGSFCMSVGRGHSLCSCAEPELIDWSIAGKREPREEGEPEPPRQKDVKEGSNYDLAQKARRFMIYVHSKLLICDDEVRTHRQQNLPSPFCTCPE